MINFSHSYLELPERFFQRISPDKFKNPQLITFNYDLATTLEIQTDGVSAHELAMIFSGQKILLGSEPISMAYAAHQFGHFVPLLGDGRAHLLGEVKGYDIQLKGSGRTCFSRSGDGRSALGPVVREYLISEAMYHLGVPSSRALAIVATGENVYRENIEPGGILTRIAPSHIRVGTFQYFAYRQDSDGLKQLLEYSIKRHYPELIKIKEFPLRVLCFIQSVAEAQAKLISQWMSIGFIHGVMNTDNFSIGGFTIDFGPCAFMDEYIKNKVFSSIDKNARYSYYNQRNIAQWNLLRLADCLLPLVDHNHGWIASKVKEITNSISEVFELEYLKSMAAKFGIVVVKKSDKKLIDEFLNYLEVEQLDFTLAFRNLAGLYNGTSSFYPNLYKLDDFIKNWRTRVIDISHLDSVNPILIPRNHHVERAINHARIGDFEVFNALTEALKTPYASNMKDSEFASSPSVDERISQTFCGT